MEYILNKVNALIALAEFLTLQADTYLFFPYIYDKNRENGN